uniref:Uncharacterized protein n=1 Tax=Timema douglasi TaxID=61478 RepID=A0A7R8Z8K8_TIMDO|nr:unnamed protein product [Timema douglasi]
MGRSRIGNWPIPFWFSSEIDLNNGIVNESVIEDLKKIAKLPDVNNLDMGKPQVSGPRKTTIAHLLQRADKELTVGTIAESLNNVFESVTDTKACKLAIPIERLPYVGEDSANIFGLTVSLGQHNEPSSLLSQFSRLKTGGPILMGTRPLNQEGVMLCLGLLNTLKIPWRICIVTVIILMTDCVTCLTSKSALSFNYGGPLSKRLSVLNKDTRKALIERKSTVTQRRLSQLSQRSSGLSSTIVPMAPITSIAPRYDTPLPKRKVSFVNKAFQPDEQEEHV